jgi:hypothetical protein
MTAAPQTAWQVAVGRLRGCVSASRESLDEQGWDSFLLALFTIAAEEGHRRFLRELRAAERDEL